VQCLFYKSPLESNQNIHCYKGEDTPYNWCHHYSRRKAMRPGGARSPCIILPGFCFKPTTLLPLPQKPYPTMAVGPGKQISGQFNSVNPRNNNHTNDRMGLNILTWLNEAESSSSFLPSLLACFLNCHFVAFVSSGCRTNYTQHTRHPQVNGAHTSPTALLGPI